MGFKPMLCKKIVLAALVSSAYLSAHAADSHYVPGLEGVKGSVLPPEGFYYKGYALSYQADKAKDANYDSDVTVNGIAHRIAWVTSKDILGADFAVEAVLPMLQTDIKINGERLDKQTGIGDLYIGAILGWHTKRWDITTGSGYWIESGKYSENHPASPGKDHDSLMLSLGINVRLNEKGDITFSALNRYEKPLKSGLDAEYIVEWGLGKSFGNYDLGLIGYNTVELDGGNEKKNAIGASLGYFSPKHMLGGDIGAYTEFSNRHTSEGYLLKASIIKGF